VILTGARFFSSLIYIPCLGPIQCLLLKIQQIEQKADTFVQSHDDECMEFCFHSSCVIMIWVNTASFLYHRLPRYILSYKNSSNISEVWFNFLISRILEELVVGGLDIGFSFRASRFQSLIRSLCRVKTYPGLENQMFGGGKNRRPSFLVWMTH
jgi:hypothetical protein